MKQRITILAILVALVGMSSQVMAQDPPSVPFRWGAHLGLNYNMAGVGYANWMTDENGNPIRPGGSFIPEVLNDGSGLGLYIGVSAQWQLLDFLGIQGRLSYDQRSLTANDDQSHTKPDGSFYNDEFNFNIGLLNLEALAKLYLGDHFHFTGGGGVGYKLDSYYTYRLDSQDPESDPIDIPGSSIVGSFVGGIGYDIYLSDAKEDQQWILTPFVEASYMVGMKEVDFSETQSGFADGLSIPTLRAGLNIAFGDAEREEQQPAMGKFFRVSPPEDGIYSTRITNEYFPIRPYVVFDSGSTAIPAEWNGEPRYELVDAGGREDWIDMARHTVMDADHAADADENRYMQGRIYYNILNIAGYRMQQTPSANLTLIGSDPVEKNGEDLANSVKDYLTSVWEIDAGRIETQGQVMPRKPAGTPRTPQADRPLATKENRRVELVSNDPSILRRAVIRAERPASEENEIYVELTTSETISSWQVTVRGEGQSKSYGPFSSNAAYMDPTGLLPEGEDEGEYTLEVVATTADGRTLSDTETFELRRNENDALAERHALIFEFSADDPVGRSEEFLEDIAPRVPNGALVIISGYTDNIGNDDFNQKLSQDRADQVKKILERRLGELGKSATVRAKGYGEDSNRHPYSNERPEGRMYNRTVIVDIIP